MTSNQLMLIASLLWAAVVSSWAIPETKPVKEGRPFGALAKTGVFLLFAFAAWIPIFPLWGAFKPSVFTSDRDSPQNRSDEAFQSKLRKFRIACIALLVIYPVVIFFWLSE